jgi:hypothetical protein
MLTVAAWLLLIVVAVPAVVITVELLLGLRLQPMPAPEGPSPRTVVLVPAHHEGAGIACMLERTRPLLPAHARGGLSPRFDPAACIWTPHAGGGGTLGQCTRWEHGFVTIARQVTVPLVRKGLTRRRFDLLWLGLHVAVPTLALLLALSGAVLLVLTLGWALGASAVPLAIDALFVALIGIGVVLAWGLHGRGQVSARTLMLAPLYVLWKIATYLRMVSGAETRWVRTDRS